MIAQDLDSNITLRNRKPGGIADQISDAGERAAFTALFRHHDAQSMLAGAESFLRAYPDSAFLAQAYEMAARGSFDLGREKEGLEYAEQSLTLLPENALLRVVVADVEARAKRNKEATRSAEDALQYLDEFANPVSIPAQAWPKIKQQQQAIAYFAIGRAKLQEALQTTGRQDRTHLLQDSLVSFAHARELNPDDQEIQYLQAMALLSSGNLATAEAAFGSLYSGGHDYAARARAGLQAIYNAQPPAGTPFEAFIEAAEHSILPLSLRTAPHAEKPPPQQLPEYAGSDACRDCHAETYRKWSETGMARMFRPYKASNVVGDFQKDNEFYTGDDIQYVHGKLTVKRGSEHRLFARMVLRSGKHFFELQQPDGSWHSYPVDYTIGSKWQQAYATRLANGEIHVLPIQYSVLEKRWLNYWRSLDGAGSERSDPYNFERLDDATSYQEKCAVCHTSQLRNTSGGALATNGLSFREGGVGCEMCHGPSTAHIAAMNAGEAYSKAPQDPPVDFSAINNREFVNICAQCHMQATLREPGAHGELNYLTEDRFFQHNQSIPYGEFTRKGFYRDGRFSQTTFIVEALQRSKCFRVGKVSCGGCHDPHSHDFSTNLTSLRFKTEPDKMCTGCHTQYVDRAAAMAHTHHPGDSEASRCVSCHMPKIMDALTFSARTHQIDDIPNAAMTLRFGQQESPNACLLCHKGKTAQWVQAQLVTWKTEGQNNRAVAANAP